MSSELPLVVIRLLGIEYVYRIPNKLKATRPPKVNRKSNCLSSSPLLMYTTVLAKVEILNDNIIERFNTKE